MASVPGRVGLGEDGFSDLSELADGYLCDAHLVFCFIVLEDIVLVALEVIEVVVFFSHAHWHFVAEDQVDPLVQLLAHLPRLQHLPHLEAKLLRGARPHRQHHCVHIVAPLLAPKVDAVAVAQELGPVVELGGQFLHVGGGSEDGVELFVDAAEEAVGMVDLASLVLPVQAGEGLQPYEEVVKHGGVGVHCAV